MINKNTESNFIKDKLRKNKYIKPDLKNRSYLGRNYNKLFYKTIQNSQYKINKYNLNKTHNEKIKKSDINQEKILKKNEEININKEDNTNTNNDNNNNNQENKENIEKSTEKEEKSILSILIEHFYNDLKNIIDKDFNLFEFKSKVGHRNVLPLMCHTILKALGLLDNRIIPLSKLEQFLYAVSDGYKETTLYHNSLHGADVTQSLMIYFINSNAEEICESNVLDLLGMMISAMGHDLGHPGLNNNFHINASTELALTYNDASCLENYHCSFLFNIIKKDETNIFEKLNIENYKHIRKRMINQILATDMANHGEVMSLIRTKIKLNKEQEEKEKKIEMQEGNIEEKDNKNYKGFILLSGNEKTKFDEQQVLLNYLIHSADLGHNCKKYEISKKWVRLLCEEFWIQGDKEKSLGIPVSFLCDRDKIDVPTSQVNFLRGFILSSFDCLGTIFPKLKYTVENAKNNIKEWQKLLDEHRVTGWTPNNETSDEDEEEDESDD